jgi:hypothetical protein
MNINKFMLSCLAGFLMVLCVNIKAASHDKPPKTKKPVCSSEGCVDPSSGDIILLDPLASKVKNKNLHDNHQEFHERAVTLHGARIKSYTTNQRSSENLYILFRQILL